MQLIVKTPQRRHFDKIIGGAKILFLNLIRESFALYEFNHLQMLTKIKIILLHQTLLFVI